MKDALIRLLRRRYIAFKLNHAPPVSKKELLAKLIAKIMTVHGREASEQHRIRIIEYDQHTGLGIVRCDHETANLLRSLLRDSTGIFGEYSVKTLGTSGSIKALRRKFLSR